MKVRALFGWVIMAMFSVVATQVISKEEGSMQNRQVGESTSHCIGRHLISASLGTTVSVRSVVGGADVKVLSAVSDEDFKRLVAEREAELKALPHTIEGSRFKERVDFADDRVLLVSWFGRTSRRTNFVELYGFQKNQSLVHLFSAESSVKGHSDTEGFLRDLSENIEYRPNQEVPHRAGFCVDRGLVTVADLNDEETRASLRVPGLPSVGISYMAYVTGAPDKPLLRRISRTPPGYEGTWAGMKTLRRGDRDIGPIKGQELLVRGNAGGKRSYEFLWESQGQADSLEYPFQSLRLTTTDESDDEGEIIEAPFADDAEALALWDSILDTLRLRPGAINAGGADLR